MPGPLRDAAELEPLLADPYPLARADRRRGARRARSRAAPTAAATSRFPTPLSTGSTWCSAPDGELRRERWT